MKQTVYIPTTHPHPKFLAVLQDDNVLYKHTKTHLEEKEGYFFTEEQLRQLFKEYTNEIVKEAKIDYHSWFFKDGEKCLFKADTYVNKESITNQLEPFLKKIL